MTLVSIEYADACTISRHTIWVVRPVTTVVDMTVIVVCTARRDTMSTKCSPKSADARPFLPVDVMVETPKKVEQKGPAFGAIAFMTPTTTLTGSAEQLGKLRASKAGVPSLKTGEARVCKARMSGRVTSRKETMRGMALFQQWGRKRKENA
jgi:hypothetical protein